MTMLQSFTQSFRKTPVEFFSDFVSVAAPFGTVTSLNGGVSPTVTYSNKNIEEFGSLSFQLPATVSTGFPRAGVYVSQAIASGAINREWKQTSAVSMLEVRAKASLSSAPPTTVYVVTCGFGLNHSSAAAGISQDLIGFYSYGGSGATWKAVVVSNYVTVKEIDTLLPIDSYCVLRTELSSGGTRALFIANGKTVMKYSGQIAVDAAVSGRLMMPHVELRDRVALGSNGTNRSIEIDYAYYKEEVVR